MTDPVKIAVIASIAPTLMGLAAFISSLVNRSKIHELHVGVNSRLTELLKQTGLAAHAEGLAQGKAESKRT
jgi:hypothetical protein